MGVEEFKNVSKVRNIALNIIHEITEHNAYANLALEKGLRDTNLSQIDKSLVTEIVNGTIRMLKHLDWVLNLFLTKNTEKLNPWIKNILRMSLYQILFMDRIPNYASVNDAVELARKKTNRNLSGLVNGVLRNIIRNIDKLTYPPANSVDYLAVYYSHPEWLVENLIKDYGQLSCEQLLAYNNERPKLHLRTNLLKTSPEELIQELLRVGIECEKSNLLPYGININKLGVALDKTEAYQKGHFYIQNLASMLAGVILNPQPNDKVYDLCSGVGGKATHLAEIMNNQGTIHCYDIYEQKLSLLKQNASRLGINLIKTYQEDVLHIEKELVADLVLLDAPCSGLGVLNRRSDLRWNKNKENIKETNDLQKQLLFKASQLVKVGGYVLYATCTTNKLENEEVVYNFLAKSKAFELAGFADKLAFFPLTEEDQALAQKGTLTIIPGKYQTDGMFYALLRRKGVS